MLRDNEFESNRSPGLADIKTFIILGKRFESTGMSNGVLFGNGDYKLNRMLQEALESKKIGDSWLDIEKNRIWIVEYTIDEGIYDIDWDDEDFSIEVEFEKPSVFHYVGKTFECSIGILNEPICIPISLPELGQLEVKVYGLHDRFLDEDFPEHENYLMLEYQAPPGIQCNFFQKDYLDGYYSEDGYSGVAGFSIDEANPDHSFEVIDCTRRVIKEPIELELFSYYVHGEEEE